jgi:hypothetical protein
LSRWNVFCRCARQVRSAIRSSPDIAAFGTSRALFIPVGVDTIVPHDRSKSGFMRAVIRSHNGVDSHASTTPPRSSMERVNSREDANMVG